MYDPKNDSIKITGKGNAIETVLQVHSTMNEVMGGLYSKIDLYLQ
jgi:hypothetical protein